LFLTPLPIPLTPTPKVVAAGTRTQEAKGTEVKMVIPQPEEGTPGDTPQDTEQSKADQSHDNIAHRVFF
jgi:hypothetical protein